MNNDFFQIDEGPGFFVAAAVHNGDKIREELLPLINLNKEERLREEDPFTAEWAEIAETTVIANYSRFEVDLNRPRDKAIYIKPEDAWGLKVWRENLPDEIINKSISEYDNFYRNLKELLDKKVNEHGGILVYDFHSYNHMRDGRDKSPADPALNPEINLGTANMNRKKFDRVIIKFTETLSSFNYLNRNLDVRENIKFKGGYFSQWIYENYPENSCVIAIEVKKFFMDEWTGIPDQKQVQLLKTAFEKSVPAVKEAFQKSLSQ